MLALTALVAQAAEYEDIVLASKVVARIRTGGKYGSVSQRGAKINQAMVQALSYEDCVNPQMSLVQVGGRWTVSVGSTTLIQVYPEDAAAAGLNEKQLAAQWKAGIATQLPLTVSLVSAGGAAVPDEGGIVLPSEPKPAGLPAEDMPLVAQVVGVFEQARGMDDAQYEQARAQLVAGMLNMIWRYRRGPEVGPPPATTDLTVGNAVRLVRLVSEQRYKIERDMIAGSTIKRVRKKYNIPRGTGPVTPPPPIGPVAPPPLPRPHFQPGTPIAKALLGTGLDADDNLQNAGQNFPHGVPQVMLYLHVRGAPNNTIVGVAIYKGDQVISRRRLQLSGDRTVGISFYPQKAEGFASGDYECRLSVADQPAGVIPFRVAAPE